MEIKEERRQLTEEITKLIINFEKKTDTLISRIDVNHLFDDSTKQKTTKINLIVSLS
jgi:hypothetical protein